MMLLWMRYAFLTHSQSSRSQQSLCVVNRSNSSICRINRSNNAIERLTFNRTIVVLLHSTFDCVRLTLYIRHAAVVYGVQVCVGTTPHIFENVTSKGYILKLVINARDRDILPQKESFPETGPRSTISKSIERAPHRIDRKTFNIVPISPLTIVVRLRIRLIIRSLEHKRKNVLLINIVTSVAMPECLK